MKTETNRELTKAQKQWAYTRIPSESKLLNAQRIDNETIRISYLQEDRLKYLLVLSKS